MRTALALTAVLASALITGCAGGSSRCENSNMMNEICSDVLETRLVKLEYRIDDRVQPVDSIDLHSDFDFVSVSFLQGGELQKLDVKMKQWIQDSAMMVFVDSVYLYGRMEYPVFQLLQGPYPGTQAVISAKSARDRVIDRETFPDDDGPEHGRRNRHRFEAVLDNRTILIEYDTIYKTVYRG